MIYKNLIKLSKQTYAFMAILVVATFSLLGQKLLPDINIPFSFYTATTNTAGIAFYQKHPHASYLISPYNDYVVENGARVAFLPKDSYEQVSVIHKQHSPPVKIWNFVTSYFGKGILEYTVKKNGIVTYSGVVNNDTFTITRTWIPIFAGMTESRTGMTILYSRDDVIVDSTGVLMTESTDSDGMVFEQETGMKVSRLSFSGRRREREGSSVTILNPRTAGSITITVPTAERVAVDNETKLIEFIDENPTVANGVHTMTMTVIVNHQKESTL